MIYAPHSMYLKPHKKKGYCVLLEDYHAEYELSGVKVVLVLKAGWVTDKRSGSSVADVIIPKWSSDCRYQASIALHDTLYSGHFNVSKTIADQWLYDNLLKCGYSKWRAKLAHVAVKRFGSYWDALKPLPYPYHLNRLKESVTCLK